MSVPGPEHQHDERIVPRTFTRKPGHDREVINASRSWPVAYLVTCG